MAAKKKEQKKVGKIDRKITPPTEEAIQGSVALEISFSEILNKLVSGYGKSGTEEGKKQFSEVFAKLLKQVATKHNCSSEYNIIILFDNTTLVYINKLSDIDKKELEKIIKLAVHRKK